MMNGVAVLLMTPCKCLADSAIRDAAVRCIAQIRRLNLIQSMLPA